MDCDMLLALAQNAVDVGNLKAACEFYETAHQNYPNNSNVLEAYAEIMLHYVQDIDRATQMLRHAINVSQNEGYVKYLNLAQILGGEESLELYKKAFQIMRQDLSRTRKKRAVEDLKRDMASCLCAIAELYLTDLCELEDAEQQCESAMEEAKRRCSDSVEVYQMEASLRLSQKDHEEALKALRYAVQLTHRLGEEYQPTYESKIELGKLLMQVNLKEAFQFLLEILQLNDTNAYVWFLLGETARLRKRYPDSARLLAHARNVAIIAQAGEEAVLEIDKTIQLLVSEIGEDTLTSISDIGTPRPLDLLEPEPEDVNVEDPENDLDDEPFWKDATKDDE